MPNPFPKTCTTSPATKVSLDKPIRINDYETRKMSLSHMLRDDYAIIPDHLLPGYAAYWEGGAVVEWLNKNRGTANYRWMVGLLEDIRWIHRAWVPAKEFGLVSLDTKPEGKTEVSAKDWGRRYRRVTRKLKQFKMWPELIRVGDLKTNKLKFTWHCGKSHMARAILALTRLGEQGILNSIQACAHCKTWFYAQFRHKRYCSIRCQQLHYKSSDEWKEHRNEYMRSYRRLEKSAGSR
jgi:hypothetical protein